MSRAELCGVAAPGEPWAPRLRPGEHALEMAVARLLLGLGRAGLVRTAAERGHRLACDTADTG